MYLLFSGSAAKTTQSMFNWFCYGMQPISSLAILAHNQFVYH